MKKRQPRLTRRERRGSSLFEKCVAKDRAKAPRLHVYAVRCAWSGPIEATGGIGGSVPCCPHCGSVLFEIEEEMWQQGIPQHEQKGHTNYARFIEWKEAQARCWPSYTEAAQAFTEATGMPVVFHL